MAHPSSATARNLLAETYLALGDEQAASREYDRMVRLSPNDPFAHRWRGEYFVQIGEYDKALDDFIAARELDPLDQQIPKLIRAAVEMKAGQ